MKNKILREREREREREKNKRKKLLCIKNYVQNERENCKFIVRGGEYEKLKLKEDKWIEEK